MGSQDKQYKTNEGGDITRMNIVFVTHLDGNKAAGLSYSIPAQIQAISKIARVLWFNDVSISTILGAFRSVLELT